MKKERKEDQDHGLSGSMDSAVTSQLTCLHNILRNESKKTKIMRTYMWPERQKPHQCFPNGFKQRKDTTTRNPIFPCATATNTTSFLVLQPQSTHLSWCCNHKHHMFPSAASTNTTSFLVLQPKAPHPPWCCSPKWHIFPSVATTNTTFF